MEKKNKKTLWIILSVVAGTIVVSIIANGIANRNDRLERDRIADLKRIEIAQEELRQAQIDDCMDSVYELYMDDWNGACKLEGKGNDCTLPIWRADKLDEGRKKNEALCVERYSK